VDINQFCRRDVKTAKEFEMTKKSSFVRTLIMALVFGLVFTACPTDSDEDPPPLPVKTLESITISSLPNKTIYMVGEDFNAAGLVVNANYSDESIGPTTGRTLVWNGSTLADGNTSITAETGEKTITVTYQGKTAEFTITVNPLAYTLAVSSSPSAGGAVSITQGNAEGNEPGATVKVTAEPAEHYTFLRWVEGNAASEAVSTDPEYTFPINKHTRLTAVFRGDGINTPFILYSLEDFEAIAENPSGIYALGSDLTGDNKVTAPVAGTFTGTFIGNGRKIELAISGTRQYGGLFEQIGAGGTVKNLSLSGSVSISNGGAAYAGAVAGRVSGAIMNIATTTDIAISGTNGDKYAGGIAGEVSSGGEITNCRNVANSVSASFSSGRDTYDWFCGGIAGYIRGRGKVTYCYVKADIRNSGGGNSGDGMRYAGGIAGAANAVRSDLNANSTITNCVDLSEDIVNGMSGGVGTGGIIGNLLYLKDTYYEDNFTHGSQWNGNDGAKDGSLITNVDVRSSWTKSTAIGGPGWTIASSKSGNETAPWWWDATAKLPKLYFE
jgi:hypothetical protein